MLPLKFVVRGMMYYRRALMLQSYMERRSLGGIQSESFWIASLSYFRSKAWTYCYCFTYFSCIISGWLFSNQHPYKSRFWVVTWITGTSRFKVYLRGVMPDLWATKTEKVTRGCWYSPIVAEVWSFGLLNFSTTLYVLRF